MFKNNVIDLSRHRKRKNKMSKNINTSKKAAPVVDMTERREAIINDERRKVRRTILTGFIGAFVVVPARPGAKGGLLKVEVYDISADGIAFDMSAKYGHYKKGDEIAMRVYLSHDVYFPFVAQVQNQRALAGEAAHRHGANFLRGTVNDEALFHFVKFIETVSASLEKDRGDVMVSGLKK
ncbi:MAG: hypothetical protein A2Z20_08085 [Bdellovibrionales bacterium RBG_16_40_8]|nr:MAG: hypothetical protein A2Z20_08085 [Bdellovibrionales bacterium RBG_16_40_8]